MKTRVMERKNRKEIIAFRETRDFIVQHCESEHYYWLKIDFKTLNAYNVALRIESGTVKLIYLLPSVLTCDGNISFENDIHSISLPVPQHLDFKNYEKRVENNSMVLVFFKKFVFAKTEFYY